MYNTKKIIKNAFRISKVRGETAIRLRTPGGHLEARYLDIIKDVAQKFGNGTVHLTARQGYEIPGVKLADMERVRALMGEMIYGIEKNSNVIMEEPEKGYPSAGTRNISACIGNRVCQFANSDTTKLTQKIEMAIYPNDYHLKVAVSGCPNDCIKAHMNDIGIIACVEPEYDKGACILCEACVETCAERVTNALRVENYKIVRDKDYCIQCGECVLKCPTGATYRGKQLYRVIVGGRTGKRNPRLAGTFIDLASEETVLAVCKNVYSFISRYIDPKPPKELVGYIIDRAGSSSFVQEVLAGISLNSEAKVQEKLVNPGYHYKYKK